MLKSFIKGIQKKVRAYAKENWGAPFIIGFVLLLVIAAISLSMGFNALANSVAVYAYYALVAGVVLQIVCFLKLGRKMRRISSGPS